MSFSPDELSERIVALLRGRGASGLRRSEARRLLGLASGAEQAAFKVAFSRLLRDGVVVKQHRGRYGLAAAGALVAGTASVHGRGFGFVTPDDGSADIFIPPRDLDAAISGDRVLVAVQSSDDERGPVGAVRKVLHRKHRVLTGELVCEYGDYMVRPLRRELPESIPIKAKPGWEPDDAEPGDWVVVELCQQDSARTPLTARFLRRLGGGHGVRADLEAVATEYELAQPYSSEQAAAAAALEPVACERDDCTALPTITIDPEDAKDFDDALSVSPGPDDGTVEVGVHIADVAAYVPAGSAFDREAAERAFTAYLPGMTLPMLPTPLAAELCSLLEGQARIAHSVFLTIDRASGEVLDTRRVRTTIKVDKRLCFADVKQFLRDEEDSPAWPEPVLGCVETLADVARVMRRRRQAEEGFLDLAMPEIRVLCSQAPLRVTGIERVEQGPAHQLVEEFMLAANSAVARELADGRIPALYRVHPAPKAGDLEDFRRRAGQLLGGRVPRLDERAAINAFLGGLESSALRDVAMSGFLAAMQRATYSTACRDHYGLGKACYCHFTSPIRRYPDLLVHQQLAARDGGAACRSADECERLAAECTGLEGDVDSAYYAAVDRLKLRYIEALVDGRAELFYEGTVSRIVGDGLVVYVPELCTYGFVAKGRLGGEPFRADRQKRAMRGVRSGKTYKCGNVIYVQVRKADITKGTLQLEPVRPRFV